VHERLSTPVEARRVTAVAQRPYFCDVLASQLQLDSGGWPRNADKEVSRARPEDPGRIDTRKTSVSLETVMCPSKRTSGKRLLAQFFIVWEIPTREVRFRVPADRAGGMPIERIAGMLAMHCLALNRRLEDFEILVLPQSHLASLVAESAKHLIEVGRSIRSGVTLSRRELEVLEGVIRNLSNKEISAKLNISISAVKAHISSLLAKFNVSNRIALGRHSPTWSGGFRAERPSELGSRK
jgi:DNA-binding CsgD family transcriptional regulator